MVSLLCSWTVPLCWKCLYASHNDVTIYCKVFLRGRSRCIQMFWWNVMISWLLVTSHSTFSLLLEERTSHHHLAGLPVLVIMMYIITPSRRVWLCPRYPDEVGVFCTRSRVLATLSNSFGLWSTFCHHLLQFQLAYNVPSVGRVP